MVYGGKKETLYSHPIAAAVIPSKAPPIPIMAFDAKSESDRTFGAGCPP